ncbi:MAG: hypothetical protein WAZ60_23785 [Desulfosalsimonadaceae bacterium]
MKSSAERDCFSLIQQIAVQKDPYCIVCGAPSSVGHHIFGRDLAAAFDPEMVRGLCEKHHVPFAHQQPEAFKTFFMTLVGDHYEQLERKSREVVQCMDFKAKRAELRELLRSSHA